MNMIRHRALLFCIVAQTTSLTAGFSSYLDSISSSPPSNPTSPENDNDSGENQQRFAGGGWQPPPQQKRQTPENHNDRVRMTQQDAKSVENGSFYEYAAASRGDMYTNGSFSNGYPENDTHESASFTTSDDGWWNDPPSSTPRGGTTSSASFSSESVFPGYHDENTGSASDPFGAAPDFDGWTDEDTNGNAVATTNGSNSDNNGAGTSSLDSLEDVYSAQRTTSHNVPSSSFPFAANGKSGVSPSFSGNPFGWEPVCHDDDADERATGLEESSSPPSPNSPWTPSSFSTTTREEEEASASTGAGFSSPTDSPWTPQFPVAEDRRRNNNLSSTGKMTDPSATFPPSNPPWMSSTTAKTSQALEPTGFPPTITSSNSPRTPPESSGQDIPAANPTGASSKPPSGFSQTDASIKAASSDEATSPAPSYPPGDSAPWANPSTPSVVTPVSSSEPGISTGSQNLNPWGFPVTPPKRDKSTSSSASSSSVFNTNPWAAASLPTPSKASNAPTRSEDATSPRRPSDPNSKPKNKSTSSAWGAYGGWGANSQTEIEKKIDVDIENVAYFLDAVDDKKSPFTEKPLDSIFNMQIEMMEGDRKAMQKAIAESLREKTDTYGYLLKKHFRLALTGGVSVKTRLPVERTVPKLNTKGMTERIMNRMSTRDQATGFSGSNTWAAFLQAEENWARLRQYMPGKNERIPKPFVIENDISQDSRSPRIFEKLNRQRETGLDYDVAVCGGTLGIFYALALQLRGLRVCVVEAGPMRGREQEWNIGMEDLMKLVELGVVSEADLEAAILTEIPGCRAAFKNKEVPVKDGYTENGIGFECFVEGVLNVGVSPVILLERVLEHFVELGGEIKEYTPIDGVFVATSVGAALDIGDSQEPLTASIVIDSLGNNSPITRQQRLGTKPNGVCAVVGTCAAGYDPKTNVFGDCIYTNTPIQNKGKNGKLQYFWQSFPVGVGRNGVRLGSSGVKTTYMFTHMDAKQKRPTLEALMEDYWRLLPMYQPSIENPESDLYVKRVLFAYFPTYKNSPLPSGFDRILAVGDAAGIQSPLSFGGFNAMTRHLKRTTDAIIEALDYGLLGKEDLAEINAYAPNLSASWLLQRSMSVRLGQLFVDPRFINRLLATNFEAMDKMGPRTIKPFLHDVVRFDGLMGTVTRSLASDPTHLPSVLAWVGLPALLDWTGHVGMMGTYSALDKCVTPWLRPIGDRALKSPEARYQMHRKMDAWKYGSGNDYNTSK